MTLDILIAIALYIICLLVVASELLIVSIVAYLFVAGRVEAKIKGDK